jgi:putative flippase GtrA
MLTYLKGVNIMAKLKDIDKAAESKGSLLVTIWQFVKFIVVSLLAMIVQFVLLNTLQLIPAIQSLYTEPFSWWVFVYPVAVGGLGYFIVSNVANIVAQIVAFFVNKEKTFNSGANVAVALPIYIVFTIALILFSAWLNPTLKDVFLGFDWCNETAAKNIATMICSALQFFLYFPVDKILFHKKKEE